MAEDELSAYSAPSHGMPESCNKSSFSAFTILLYLAFRSRWQDLAYGTSIFWALGLKLQFQKCYFKNVFKYKIDNVSPF
jgi:hypothetical protein